VKRYCVSVCNFRKLIANMLFAMTVPIAIRRSFQAESLKVAEQVLLKAE